MMTRMLVLLVVFAGTLVLASPGFPGALVAQPNSPTLSGEGNPEDWGAPVLSVSGKPEDWDSPAFSIKGRPVDGESIYRPQGRPEDWGSPSFSFWSILGKPEDWDGPVRGVFRSLRSLINFR